VCGLLAEGGVVCWRLPGGEHREHTRTQLTFPADLEIRNATDLVGQYAMCALADGDAFCWSLGGRVSTQGGDYDADPERRTHTGDLVQLETAGWGLICGLRRNGSVVCWGGPVGLPYMVGIPPERNWTSRTPREVQLGVPLRWIRSVGSSFCGADFTGMVHCWSSFFDDLPLAWSDVGIPLRDQNLFVAYPFELRVDAPAIAGNSVIGCVFDGPTPRCVTNDARMRASCPGGLELAHLVPAP